MRWLTTHSMHEHEKSNACYFDAFWPVSLGGALCVETWQQTFETLYRSLAAVRPTTSVLTFCPCVEFGANSGFWSLKPPRPPRNSASGLLCGGSLTPSFLPSTALCLPALALRAPVRGIASTRHQQASPSLRWLPEPMNWRSNVCKV